MHERDIADTKCMMANWLGEKKGYAQLKRLQCGIE